MNSEVPIDQELDASGLDCPLPVLRTKAALARLQPGECLRVIATDRHAPLDFQVYCMRSGHELLSQVEDAERLIFVIRKAGGE